MSSRRCPAPRRRARARGAANRALPLIAGLAACLAAMFQSAAGASPYGPTMAAGSPAPPGYDALLTLYGEFRRLAVPEVVNGVPDYSPAAMAAQHAALGELQERLHALDEASWPIPWRVDYMLVLAEMRGLEFQHRVLRPWARDPAFYSTTNLGFGPKMHGAMGIPELPLAAPEVAVLGRKLEAVPAILASARETLTDPRGDLARLAIEQQRIAHNVYDRLTAGLDEHHPEIAPAARRARDATADFRNWLLSIEAELPPHGGVGREHYDWYLRHVLLFPYTAEEARIIGEREYERAMVFLKMEEHRNRAIPMIEPADTLAEFEQRRAEADTELLRFLRDEQIMTVPEWLVPARGEGPYILPADRDPARPGPFDAPIRRHFFREAEDRDPRPLRAHNLPGHRYDSLALARDDRPIRGDRRLFFIGGVRAEGWAMYLEEMITQTGFLEDRPKTREINYILQAKRAARILPELRMHSNTWTWQEALVSLTNLVPYWMGPDDAIARFDLELYLRQPGYGIGYYMGKVELEALLAEAAADEGRDFDLQRFHDRFLASGQIPISLIRWEMTGRDDQVRTMR
jgi:hypothetical protein